MFSSVCRRIARLYASGVCCGTRSTVEGGMGSPPRKKARTATASRNAGGATVYNWKCNYRAREVRAEEITEGPQGPLANPSTAQDWQHVPTTEFGHPIQRRTLPPMPDAIPDE